MMMTKAISFFFLALAIGASSAQAQNVDLSTLPERSSVQLTIYNSEDLTLVRETRRVSFREGANVLQFSWSGTRIDPSSVQLRFLSHQGDLELVDTMFPHQKPQMLYWNIASERTGDAVVEVSYFTAGISWAADYQMVTNDEEQTLKVQSFVRINNQSGEDYEHAKVRLVVGSLNLVQRIADLAGVSVAQVDDLADEAAKDFKIKAARRVMESDSLARRPTATSVRRPKAVKKESLSEYYLFTVEGSETVPSGWSKRLRSFEAKSVPFEYVHRYRPAQYGAELVRLVVTKNTKASKLGKAPWPDGVVRVFSEQGGDSLAYRGQQKIAYVPVGEDVEILLGPDRNVTFELIRTGAWREHFEFHNASVVGWDEYVTYAQRVRNFSSRPLQIEVRRAFSGQAELRTSGDVKVHDVHTAEFRIEVAPHSDSAQHFSVSTRAGRRARQNALTVLQQAPASP